MKPSAIAMSTRASSRARCQESSACACRRSERCGSIRPVSPRTRTARSMFARGCGLGCSVPRSPLPRCSRGRIVAPRVVAACKKLQAVRNTRPRPVWNCQKMRDSRPRFSRVGCVVLSLTAACHAGGPTVLERLGPSVSPTRGCCGPPVSGALSERQLASGLVGICGLVSRAINAGSLSLCAAQPAPAGSALACLVA